MVVVVEACTSLNARDWPPIQTNTLSGDLCHLSDPNGATYPRRFYRLRWRG
jgi:hypothetical protein